MIDYHSERVAKLVGVDGGAYGGHPVFQFFRYS